MGRGSQDEHAQQLEAPGGGRRAAELTTGTWRRKDESSEELEVIGADPDAAHLALVARDRFGARLIAPEVLRSRYELARAGDGRIRIAKPRRRRAERSFLTTQDSAERKRIEERLRERFGAAPGTSAAAEPATPRQLRYLESLCAKAGEPFPGELTKSQASQHIERLKRRLEAA